MSQPAAIVLRSQDDVAVAARRLEPGEDLDLPVGRIPVRDLVGMGHKIALRAISRGEPVRKYGQVIGFATKDIPAGSLVHVNNIYSRAPLDAKIWDDAVAKQKKRGNGAKRGGKAG